MNTKKIILLAILGVIAVVGFMMLQKITTPPPPAPAPAEAPVAEVVSTVEYVEVLAAARDIPQGTRLTQDMLKWKKWPAEALEPNLIDQQNQPQALEEYTGAVTRVGLFAGEPILAPKVVKTGEKGQMAALLSPGMRAIAVRITTDSAAAGFIQPGDRVDVILTTQIRNPQMTPTGRNAANTYVSNAILENVKVLAIGQTNTPSPDGSSTILGNTALLELSLDDAELLQEAQSRGELSLALRGLDKRMPGHVPSAATTRRNKSTGQVSSMVIYRNGQKQQVAIQGH